MCWSLSPDSAIRDRLRFSLWLTNSDCERLAFEGLDRCYGLRTIMGTIMSLSRRLLVAALPLALSACPPFDNDESEGWIDFRGAGGSYQLSHIVCVEQIRYSGYGFDVKGISIPISYAGFSTTLTVGSADISPSVLQQATSIVQIVDASQASACKRSIIPPPSEAYSIFSNWRATRFKTMWPPWPI